MTYGFEIKNSSGDVVANDRDFNWVLFSEGSIQLNSIDDNANLLPAAALRADQPMPLIFIRAPTSRRIFLIKMDYAQINGLSYWAPKVYLKNTSESSPDSFPETVYYKIYFIAKNIIYSGPDIYGITIYNNNGEKTFDSRIEIATIVDTLTLTYQVWDGSYASNPFGISFSPLVSTPQNIGTPWLSSTDVYEANSYKGMYSIGANRYYFDSYYQNISNYITGGFTRYNINITNPSTPVSWNNNSGKTHKVLIMRGTSTPLKLWVVPPTVPNSSCDASGGTCSTSETFYTQFAGGNSNPVTHSWQVIGGNANSFSLTYPYSNGCTVALTAGPGTYSTTLRCTLSQSGSANVIVDTPITRTHTSGYVFNPLGFNNTTYTDDGDGSGSARMTVRIKSNGTWLVTSENGGDVQSGNWYSSAPNTTIGNSYYCKFTMSALSSLPSGTTSNVTPTTSWLQLNTDQEASIDIVALFTTYRQRSVTYTIEISTDASGSNIVSTSTIYFIVKSFAY